jgi:hypothetical protein
MVSNSVEILVDVLRDRSDLTVQLFFNGEQVLLVVLSDEVYGET